jgi:2-polyprenyl-3-methyl-5-hydroxy-6-metoxy-1,4-benzoquinol methylase
VELLRGDALALPQDLDGAFDVVTCVGAFGHVLERDEDRFVAGIVRALRPGGRFVFATGRRPRATSAWFWMAHGFNAVMRVRNALLRPSFVMYYLTFLWPEVVPLLERHGLRIEAREGLCPSPFERVVIVSARKPR